MSKGQQRRLAFFALGVIIAVVLYASNAHAEFMGGVGTLMSPTGAGGSTPGGGFAILTESGSPLTTESSSILVTENAP